MTTELPTAPIAGLRQMPAAPPLPLQQWRQEQKDKAIVTYNQMIRTEEHDIDNAELAGVLQTLGFTDARYHADRDIIAAAARYERQVEAGKEKLQPLAEACAEAKLAREAAELAADHARRIERDAITAFNTVNNPTSFAAGELLLLRNHNPRLFG